MQRPNHRFLPLLLILLASAQVGFAQDTSPSVLPPGFQRWDFKVDGVAREALVYLPTTAKEKLAPVVFVFHGHGGTARNVVGSFAINRHWLEWQKRTIDFGAAVCTGCRHVSATA